MNTTLGEFLKRHGVTFVELTGDEADAALQRWVEAYVGASVVWGGWRYGSFPERFFERDRVVGFEGRRAVKEYAAVEDRDFFLLQAEPPFVVRCHCAELPELGAAGGELCVTALDCSWTMAWSHEDRSCGGLGVGPWFARAEWQRPLASDPNE